jgi:Fe-S-cluster containining protein
VPTPLGRSGGAILTPVGGGRSGIDEEAEHDALLLAEMDRALARAAQAADDRLDHRRGCPACCIGPFPITVLDARRLGRGLRTLAARDPDRAAAVHRRARETVALVAASFPGDPATGRLADDEAAEESFAETWADLPCPALDPPTGSCDLYSHRPLSCRSYGPPVRVGSEDLPPCHLCFVGSAEESATCRALLDPDGREDALLRDLAARGLEGETIVAFALAAEV